MEDGDAETAVGVDVGVPDGTNELEVCDELANELRSANKVNVLTRWAVGIVLGERHDSLEVAAIV
jgi:hypothetical protein